MTNFDEIKNPMILGIVKRLYYAGIADSLMVGQVSKICSTTLPEEQIQFSGDRVVCVIRIGQLTYELTLMNGSYHSSDPRFRIEIKVIFSQVSNLLEAVMPEIREINRGPYWNLGLENVWWETNHGLFLKAEVHSRIFKEEDRVETITNSIRMMFKEVRLVVNALADIHSMIDLTVEKTARDISSTLHS